MTVVKVEIGEDSTICSKAKADQSGPRNRHQATSYRVTMITRRDFVGTASAGLATITAQPLSVAAASTGRPDLPSVQPPLANLDKVHDHLAAFCGTDSLGCAIDIGLLSEMLRKQLRETRTATDLLSFPTSFPQIHAGMTLDTTALEFVTSGGKLFLKGFKPTVVLYADTTPQVRLADITIEFTPAELTVALTNAVHGVMPLELANRPTYPQPVESYNGTQTAVSQAVVRRAVAGIIAAVPYLILEQFVSTLPMPSALAAMRGLVIEVAHSMHVVDNWLLIKGPPGVGAHDLCEQLGVTHSVTQSPLAAGPGPGDFNVPRNDVTASAPTELQARAEQVHFAFYYPKAISWQPLAEAKVLPALAPEPHEGGVAMFRTYHAVAGIVDKPLIVELDPATRQLRIKSKVAVTGNAGFALKVGCVYQPMVPLSVVGRIDPCDFTITFDVRRTATGLGLVGVCELKSAISLGLTGAGNPGINFVLSFIMNQLIECLLTNKLNHRINDLTFKILHLDGLLPRGRVEWATDQSWRPASTVFGVEARRG